MYVFFFVVIIILVIALVIADGVEQTKHPRKYTEMKCPTCGSPARNYGTSWECTWCGDFGRIGKY